jgi:hypothetical protein
MKLRKQVFSTLVLALAFLAGSLTQTLHAKPDPPDMWANFNTANLTPEQITDHFNRWWRTGVCGPFVTVPQADGSTTIFGAGYGGCYSSAAQAVKVTR